MKTKNLNTEELGHRWKRLTEVLAKLESSANEADTRFQAIDPILKEVLDWPRLATKCEYQTDSGPADYVCFVDERALVVVEAKRAPLDFGLKKNGVTPIAKLLKSGKDDLGKAIRQAVGYAKELASPVAVVTNAFEWVFIGLNTDGQDWKKGNGYVLVGRGLPEKDFETFHGIASPSGILSRHLFSLLAPKLGAPFPKPLEAIPNSHRSKSRNDRQMEFQMIGEEVFAGTLFKDRTYFQNHCYANPGAVSKDLALGRDYLKNLYPDLFAQTAGVATLAPAVQASGIDDSLVNASVFKKPVLILGEVGVGKSTFLERLFSVELKDKESNLIPIRVDLSTSPSMVEDVPKTICVTLEEALRTEHGIDIREDKFVRSVYHAELKRLKGTPQGRLAEVDAVAYLRYEIEEISKWEANVDHHLKRVFEHLRRSHRRGAVLIIDNVDQRDSSFQSAAFAQALVASTNWEISVFIALRPETYVRSSRSGTLSAYHNRAFTISPPRLEDVLDRRIEAGINLYSGNALASQGVTINYDTVVDYLLVIQRSLRQNPELIEFGLGIAGTNMRRLMDMFAFFMGSGHVHVDKILRSKDTYVIPLHELMRGVMFGDREFFDPNHPFIANLYDCKTNDSREPFGRLALLGILNQKGTEYAEIADLWTIIGDLGFHESQFNTFIEELLRYSLIESNLKTAERDDEPTSVRISPCGSYYYLVLVRKFAYLDIVLLTCPIEDEEVRQKIRDVQDIFQRLDRANHFIKYLDNLLIPHPELKRLSGWSSIRAELQSNMLAVDAGAKRFSH